jgi:putative membrane protein insertion efficiency factor
MNPQASRIARWPILLLIRAYQAVHGSFFHGVCRFQPTCSHYAIEAVETRGVFMGLALAAWRILRCQPFARGGYDPVPAPRSVAPFRAWPARRMRISQRRFH